MHKDEVQQVREKGDSLLTIPNFDEPAPSDFEESDTIIILIHGFTSHGKYMAKLGAYLRKWGNQAFLFNYNSYRGIDRAAQSLKSFLLSYDMLSQSGLRKKGVFLIAHSMGGLVARSLVTDDEARQFVRGMVMLGTPNNGAFEGNNLLQYLVEYGEYLAGVMPEAQTPFCISSKQLTRSDTDKERPYIDSLNDTWKTIGYNIPTLTISGGKRYLVFCDNPLRNALINRMVVQKMIGDKDNDGLIIEDSVNITAYMPDFLCEKYRHYNSYADYAEINHTNLIQNQMLTLQIMTWVHQIQKS